MLIVTVCYSIIHDDLQEDFMIYSPLNYSTLTSSENQSHILIPNIAELNCCQH